MKQKLYAFRAAKKSGSLGTSFFVRYQQIQTLNFVKHFLLFCSYLAVALTKALQNMDRTLPKELFFHGSNPSTPYFREKSIYENAPEKSGADKQRNRAFARFRGTILNCPVQMVGEDGFEPSKLEATDLQSAPFGRSGILPYIHPEYFPNE